MFINRNNKLIKTTLLALVGVATFSACNKGSSSSSNESLAPSASPKAQLFFDVPGQIETSLYNPKEMLIIIQNKGKETANNISLSEIKPPLYIANGEDNCSGQSLTPSEYCSVNIEFRPTEINSDKQNVTLSYLNGSESNLTKDSFDISYLGRGSAKLDIQTPQGISTAVGTSKTINLTMTNNGEENANDIAFSTLLAPLSITSNNCPKELSKGQSCNISVKFKPTEIKNGSEDLLVEYYDKFSANPLTKETNISYFGFAGNDPENPIIPEEPPSDGKFAYVPNGTTVSVCEIEESGALTNCTNAAPGFNFGLAKGIAIQNERVYITDYFANSVKMCKITSNNSLSDCIATGAGFNTPKGISIYNNYAYITNGSTVSGSGTVSVCKITSNGSLSECKTTGSGYTNPQGITTFNGRSYFPNNNGDVTVCNIDPNGELSSCKNQIKVFSPAGISVNNQRAYIAGVPFSEISACDIAANGDFSGSCNTMKLGFKYPRGITIHNNHAYVINYQTDTINLCNIAANGSLSECTPTGSGFNKSDAFNIAITSPSE